MSLGFLQNFTSGTSRTSRWRWLVPSNIDGDDEEDLSYDGDKDKSAKARRAARPVSVWSAAATNLVLLSIFALQHSTMARDTFKRLVPASLSHLERTFYVLLSATSLHLALGCWRPMPQKTYDLLPFASSRLKSLVEFAFQSVGFALQLWAITILDRPKGSFFGMFQAGGGVTGEGRATLSREGPLAYVRHPIMTGFFLQHWGCMAPSHGRLLFNAAMTGYILCAVFSLEEPALELALGAEYARYKTEVGAFIPRT